MAKKSGMRNKRYTRNGSRPAHSSGGNRTNTDCRFARGARTPARRSEERRVGKECRSRWWPHHLKKQDEGGERIRTHEDHEDRGTDGIYLLCSFSRLRYSPMFFFFKQKTAYEMLP